MKRGEIFRFRRPPGDPKPARSFVVVSRQALIDSGFSTVVCAPIFTERHGLPTQIAIGVGEGMKHDCAIYCDGLVSIEKSKLTDFVGELSVLKLEDLNGALAHALSISPASP